MSLNNKIYLVLILALVFMACQNKPIDFCVADNYNGPCIVFIKEDIESNNVYNKIILINGLGKVSNQKLKQNFIIKSLNSDKELQVIPIGKHDIAIDSVRYIFQLTEGLSSSNCSSKDLKMISFFVGFKSDYISWIKNYHDELEHFEKIGIDWCKFYNDTL